MMWKARVGSFHSHVSDVSRRDAVEEDGAETSCSRRRKMVVVAINHRLPNSHLGELYSTVADFLVASGSWRLKPRPLWPYHLCLGESIGQGIPYHSLSRSATATQTPPLVNFFQRFKPLTWKADMVVTLERFCKRVGVDLTCVIPESFVFYSGQDNGKQLRSFEKSFRRSKTEGRGVWILKPSHGGKGNAIELVRLCSISLSHPRCS